MRHILQYHPHLKVVSDEQVQAIHLASLEILERTGTEVRQKRALELLEKAGARIDGARFFIPASLVDQAIHSAPERVMISTRTGKRVMPLERDRVFFGTGSDTPNTIDPYSRERRRARRADVANFAKLCDALPNIDFTMSMGIPEDAPVAATYVYEFADMLSGSIKPIVFTAGSEQEMVDIYEMAAAASGGESSLQTHPFFIHYAEPISPLLHSPEGLGKLLFCAGHGIPVAYVSGMLAGGNGPVTLASACALANAECLSGLVIHQLAAQGAPFVYGANLTALDMRTAGCAYGAPEYPLTSAVFAQLARLYRLPVWGMAGATDAKTVDAQAGLEAMFSISMALLSRGNLIHDVGYIESGLTSSMEMLIVCSEIIDMLQTMVRGIPCTDEHLAINVIDEVGVSGNFFATDHTAAFFRTEHFLPGLLDRRNFENWLLDGSKTLADRANERAREIVSSHQPAPLPDYAYGVIEKVLERAGKRCIER